MVVLVCWRRATWRVREPKSPPIFSAILRAERGITLVIRRFIVPEDFVGPTEGLADNARYVERGAHPVFSFRIPEWHDTRATSSAGKAPASSAGPDGRTGLCGSLRTAVPAGGRRGLGLVSWGREAPRVGPVGPRRITGDSTDIPLSGGLNGRWPGVTGLAGGNTLV